MKVSKRNINVKMTHSGFMWTTRENLQESFHWNMANNCWNNVTIGNSVSAPNDSKGDGRTANQTKFGRVFKRHKGTIKCSKSFCGHSVCT